jgi:hypothetical protein
MTVNSNLEPGAKNDLVDQVGELEEPSHTVGSPEPKAPVKKTTAKKK